jgi:hypothetical protein
MMNRILLLLVILMLKSQDIDTFLLSRQSCRSHSDDPIASRWRRRRHHEASPEQSPSSISSSFSTNKTITIPAFSPHTTASEGSYPSVLHSIHIESLLTDDQARRCLELAQQHAAETNAWDRPDTERHATYSTCDFPIEDCENLQQYLENDVHFHELIWNRLSSRYGVSPRDMSYLDLFCVNYQSQNEEETSTINTMDRLEAHRDGSLLSFTVLLSPPESFEGGGTFFDALRDVNLDEYNDDTGLQQPILFPGGVIRPPRAGDVVLHSGKILHGADKVTSGSRCVLVGFVDVNERCCREGTLGEAAKEWGRMDVATYHFNRQQAKSTNKRRGWIPNNGRWLPGTNREISRGRSSIWGFLPVLESFASRADPEYQRRHRLEAEDILLRSILLPKPRGMRGTEQIFDDITIL